MNPTARPSPCPPIRFGTDAEFVAICARRPPGYAQEIAPAIVRRVAGGMYIDAAHPAWRAAAIKYRKPQPPTWGPRMWAELHRATPLFPLTYVLNFAARIPCDDCLNHLLSEVARNPPPPDGCRKNDWRAFTVIVHDEVSRLIGKPTATSWEEACRRWDWTEAEGSD